MKMLISGMIEATRLVHAGRFMQANALFLVQSTAFLQRQLFWGWPPRDSGRHGTLKSSAPDRDLLPVNVPQTGFETNTPAKPGSACPLPGMFQVPHVIDRIARIAAMAPVVSDTAAQASREKGGVPPGARFLTASHTGNAGTCVYKLYVPSAYCGHPLPLIVMLHGCTQSADDFAAGTGMNAMGEAHACFVAYPVQPRSANGSNCWNWFRPKNQQRGRGEPSLIAGIASQIMADFAIDRRRVYVAGLSAGGAAAAVLGATYPDIFAAVGVQSGLACGAARNIPSALTAMRHGRAADSNGSLLSPGYSGNGMHVPTIVFHGDRDRTVHPRNGDQVIEQSRARGNARGRMASQRGRIVGGHSYTQTSYLDSRDQTLHEMWVVHEAGHAWSGGSPAGSHTDPYGPDASREMLRFFLEHPHPFQPDSLVH
jgi:poly(hydroxyalkanoate) depolymerase family esterase